MNGKQTTLQSWFRITGLILLVLIVGVQFVPRSGPFRVSRGSAIHHVESRVICYGWPVILYGVRENRITAGVGHEKSSTTYSKDRGMFFWDEEFRLF